MLDFLAFLQDVDLGRYALQLGQLLNSADPWLLGIAVSLFVGIGHKLAVGNRLVYGWGLRLAALSFLVYFGVSIWQAGELDQVQTSAVLARSGIVAGCVLSLIWILLPVILFVYGNFVFGLAGFVCYVGYALLSAESIETEALPAIGLRGLLVAGLAMVLAWILRPIWELAASVWLAHKPAPALAGEPMKTQAEIDPRLSRLERRQRRLARLQARQQAQMAAGTTVLAEPAQVQTVVDTPTWSGKGKKTMLAPADPVSAETPVSQEADDRRRRDKARLDVELAYLLAMPQLGSNFPRPLFDGWVMRYLGSQLPADEVEENSWQMQKTLRQYHPQADAGQANLNLEDLHVWFLDEQRRIHALQVDTAERQAKLLALQDLYVSLSQRFLGDGPTPVVQMLRSHPAANLALPEAVAAR